VYATQLNKLSIISNITVILANYIVY